MTGNTTGPVLWEIDARGVARVTLNRPEVNNAYNGALIDGVLAALDAYSMAPRDRPAATITLGETRRERPDSSYNAAVQELYAAELRRARESAEAVAAGRRVRGPADEIAFWDELEAAQRANETAACRSVGLSVETRPDHVTPEELRRIRRLGATKVQLGVQASGPPL